jgi:hypothetical protein
VRSRNLRSAAVLAGALVLGTLVAPPASADSGTAVPTAAAGALTIWVTGPKYAVPSSVQSRVVTAVAAADGYTLALTSDGRVTAWGPRASPSLLAGTSAARNVTAVSASAEDALALDSDGSVTGWYTGPAGADDGITDVPPEIQGHVTKIAAGYRVGMALLDSGAVAEWGENAAGTNAPPAGLSNVVAIAAPHDSTTTGGTAGPFLAVTSDHTVVSWGERPDTEDDGQYDVPSSVQGKAVAVVSGSHSAAAITTAGSAVIWGQLATADTGLVGQVVADLTLRSGYAMALTTDGQVSVFGEGDVGADPAVAAVPDTVQGHATAIALAGDHALVLTPFTATSVPTITGTPRVGETVSASGVASFLGVPSHVDTQWLADGVPIPGATLLLLAVTPDLVGKTITLAQTATFGSGGDVRTLAATSPGIGPVVAQQATTSLTATGQRATYGSPTRIDVTLAPSTATGVVRMAGEGNTLAIAAVASGHAALTVPGTALSPGRHGLTITYSGDVDHTTATTALTLTVRKAKAHLGALKSQPHRLTRAKLAKARATMAVNAHGYTPTGKVTLKVKHRHGKAKASVRHGVASFRLGDLGAALRYGRNKVTVVYHGDDGTHATRRHALLALRR